MQINQLPTIPQAPTDGDVMAIEVNGVTYKVSKALLASAILSQLGDPVGVSHGGTNATTAAGARTNLSVYSKSETDSAISSSISNSISYGRAQNADLVASRTLMQMGAITSAGIYMIALTSQENTTSNVTSVYTARYNNGTFYKQSTIFEGTANNTPILQSSGMIVPKSGTIGSEYSVRWLIMRFM